MTSETAERIAGRMYFDKTISLGHILTIMTLIGGMLAAYVTYRETITEHRGRIHQLEMQMQHQIAANQQLSDTMWTIKQDVAVIRDRIERQSAK